jgi:hypothetical protein
MIRSHTRISLVLPPKPIHHPPQRRPRLLRPRRQLLALTVSLLRIRAHNAALLWSLWCACKLLALWRCVSKLLALRRRRASKLLRTPILRHLHPGSLLLIRALGRKILRRRIGVVVQRGRLGVALLLALWVVGILLGVESEVVLGDLAVAAALRVGY